MGIDIPDNVSLLYSASYGIQRLVWVFDQAQKFDAIQGYGKSMTRECEVENLELCPAGLCLSRGHAVGAWTTGPTEAPGFDWMVPWWNADCSGGGCVSALVQVESEGGWSSWYPVEQWGAIPRSFSRKSDGTLCVETDTALLPRRSERFRLRIVLSKMPLEAGTLADGKMDAEDDFSRVGGVVLHRCGILTRDRNAPRPQTRRLYLRESLTEVPPLSQMDEAEAVRGRICSPTCVTMALRALGRIYPTAFVAADCYDFGEKIYGNWAFNVASLWRLGAQARLDFFPTAEQAGSELFFGKILIASIRFQDGSLGGAPIQKTNGHLVLLKGVRRRDDGSWGIVVNDPAAGDVEGVPRVYDIDEFERAWSGLAYVVEGPRPVAGR